MIDLQLNNNSALDEVFIKRLMYDILMFNNLDDIAYTNPPGGS